jgi:hypothetical protein
MSRNVRRRRSGSLLPSGGAVGPPGVWLRHRRVFQPQAGAGDLRFGRVALHRRERPPRPRYHRHLPAALSQGDRALFVQVLLLAREIGVLKMGTAALDGAKVHANASRHSALSYEHAGKIEAQLKAEVADLLARAEAADQADVPDGMSIPEELERREKRLETIASAGATIEARAKERFERDQAEHLAAKTEATGKKPRGKEPKPPVEGPLPTDQVNLTDEESRIMPVAGGGFEQRYNAQAVVAEGSLLVVVANVVQAANDKQQLAPMLNKVVALPDVLGKVETLLADNGYFSAANVVACDAALIEPLIAMGRQSHHPSPDERFADAPPPPKNPTPVEAMAYRLKTPKGIRRPHRRQLVERSSRPTRRQRR